MKETGFILSTKGDQEWPPKTVKTAAFTNCSAIEFYVKNWPPNSANNTITDTEETSAPNLNNSNTPTENGN